MQIVIDDKKIIDLLETEWGYEGIREDVRRLLIENGTPLPKGHGRLIDENKLLENLKESANHHANNSREESLLYRDRVIVREQPTIIGADTAESEG